MKLGFPPWMEQNAVFHTEEEKQKWEEEIYAYRPNAEGIEKRKKFYPNLASKVDIGSLNVFDMIDMDEGRIPVQR